MAIVDVDPRNAVRLGVLLPAANITAEPELTRYGPPRVTYHFQRFTQSIKDKQQLPTGLTSVVQAAVALAAARPAVLGVAYTAGSYVGGNDWDRALRLAIQDAAGCPAVTAASAIVEALRHLGGTSVSVVSPYSQGLNAQLETFLSAAGLDVRLVVGRPTGGPAGDIPYRKVEQMVMEVEGVPADAVLISCTGLKTLPLIGSLESRLDVPVISSNQALLWALSRRAAIDLGGPGRLCAS